MTETALDGEGEVRERLAGGYSGRMLGLVAVGAMVSLLGQLVFPPLLPVVIAEFGISPAAAGLLLTTIMVLAAVSRFPGGRLADHLSQKTVLVGGLGLAVAALVVFSVAVSYPMLVVGAVLLGMGTGVYFPAALAQISDLFVDRRGTAMGLHTATVNVGGAIASGLAIAALAAGSWRLAFLPVLAALLAVAALIHAWNAQPYVLDVGAVEFDVRGTVGRLVDTPGLALVLSFLALFAFAWQGFLTFLPTYLQVERGFSPALASAAFASFFITGTLANPIAGRFGDRFSHPRVAAVAAGVAALSFALVLLSGSTVGVVVGIVGFGVGGTAVWPLMMAYVMDLLPAESMGGDFGALSMAYIAVGSLGPTYVGVVAEAASYTVAYATLVVGLVLGIGLALALVVGAGKGDGRTEP